MTNKKVFGIIIIENEREVTQMRKMVYVLSNGTIETTEQGAKDSGFEYRVAFQEIVEDPTELMSEKALANRKKVVVK